jgi:hypothetical protein
MSQSVSHQQNHTTQTERGEDKKESILQIMLVLLFVVSVSPFNTDNPNLKSAIRKAARSIAK